MRPSRDMKSFRYMLDYIDCDGKRRQVSLGHADKRQAERQRHEKELQLRMNVADPVSMRLTEFFRDSVARTKGQVCATTLSEIRRSWPTGLPSAPASEAAEGSQAKDSGVHRR